MQRSIEKTKRVLCTDHDSVTNSWCVSLHGLENWNQEGILFNS